MYHRRTRARDIDREPIYAVLRDRAGIDLRIAEVRMKLGPLHAELDQLLKERDNMSNKNLSKIFNVSETMLHYMESGER